MYNPQAPKFFQLTTQKDNVFGFVDLRNNKEYTFVYKDFAPRNFKDESGKLLTRLYNKSLKAKIGIPSGSMISTEFVQMTMFAGRMVK